MHTGNQPPFAGGLVQQDLPGTPGLFRIDVEGDRGFWPRRLNGREMDDIPPDQQRGIARFETIPGMPGRMAGQRARADPGDHLLIINPADLRRAVRQYTANKQHVAPAAIAGVVERGWSPARLILNAAADVPPPPVRYPRVRTAALTSDHHSRQSPSGRQRSTYKREQVTWRPHARCAGLRNRAVMG